MALSASVLNVSSFELNNKIYYSGFFERNKLTISAKMVLQALCRHYNPANETAFPSIAFMAKKLGITERTVLRSIKELTKTGFIIYETKKVNHYKFTEKFFNDVYNNHSDNLSYPDGQIVTPTPDKLSPKHIIEKIKEVDNTSSCQNQPDEIKQESQNCEALNDDDKNKLSFILEKMKEYNYHKPRLSIKTYGINRIQACIQYIEAHKINSKGAYLRYLLQNKINIITAPKNQNVQTEVNYKSPEATRQEIKESLKRDDKSIFNDLETAINYINSFTPDDFKNDFINVQVQRIKTIWNLQ